MPNRDKELDLAAHDIFDGNPSQAWDKQFPGRSTLGDYKHLSAAAAPTRGMLAKEKSSS